MLEPDTIKMMEWRTLTTRSNGIVSVLKAILCTLIFLAVGVSLYAQGCSSSTPVIYVDLSANPDSVWTSSPMSRSGQCCGVASNQKCIKFIVTLNEYAEGIALDVSGGAGSTNYSLGCSTSTSVGSMNCIYQKGGVHELTVCKPGSNSQSYIITSYSAPYVSTGNPITTTASCPVEFNVKGIKVSTIKWAALDSPAYNSWLSCLSGCSNTTVTPPVTGYPAYADFRVSGYSKIACDTSLYADTIRLYILDDPQVTVSPDPARICPGSSDIEITANVTGGIGPFAYLWSNGSTDTFATVTPGIYNVNVQDLGGCMTAMANAVAVQLPVATVDAGNDTAICSSVPNIQLHGSVTNADGAKWSGGAGSFSPNDSDINAIYSPSVTDIQNGSVTLYFTTTGPCDPVMDSMVLTINPIPEPEIAGTNITCYTTDTLYYKDKYLSGGSTYQWYISGGIFPNGNASRRVEAVWLNVGVNNISLTETINSTGCSNSANLNVTVHPPATATDIEH